jgi:preprotein translocase subunit SecD
MRNNFVSIVLILLLTALTLFIVLPIEHPAWLENALGGRDLKEFRLGLDLQGGTQVMLEADLAEGQPLDTGAVSAARTIVENRVNGLGVAEAIVQQQGDNRLIVELPGIDDPLQAVETLRSTGQLEFVDPAGASLSQGMVINTTNRPTAATDYLEQVAAGTADPALVPYPDQVFETVMTGDVLRNAIATQDQFNQWLIQFELTGMCFRHR